MGLSENFGFLDNVLNLLICESLKEIGEMACDTNGLVLSWTDSYRVAYPSKFNYWSYFQKNNCWTGSTTVTGCLKHTI